MFFRKPTTYARSAEPHNVTLVDGQTYYIAVDGSGGDNCTWGFSGTGIVLPIRYAKYGAKLSLKLATGLINGIPKNPKSLWPPLPASG